MLPHEDSAEHGRTPETVATSPICDVGQTRKAIPKIDPRGLRIGTWNFQGLCTCSDRKALEIDEVLAKNHIDIIGGQEAGSWIVPKFLCLVINGLLNLGKELKVSVERVAWVLW